METKYIPELGKQWGSWTVISDQVKRGGINAGANNRTAYWKVKCICGREAWRAAHHIVNNTRGRQCKSCARSDNYKNAFALSYIRKIIDRAKKIEVEYDLDPEFLWNLYIDQDKKCALSGEEINFTNSWRSLFDQTCSLDRIDNNKGYTKDNVQWVHKDINFMKGRFTEERFKELCAKVHSKC